MSRSAKVHTVAEIASILGDDLLRVVGREDRKVVRPMPINSATSDAICFCSFSGELASDLLHRTKAGTIVVGADASLLENAERTYIVVRNPRRDFLRLVARVFAPAASHGVHASAVVSEQARIHPSAFIGARAVVGNCTIGANSVVHAGAVLYDQVTLGQRVIVHAGAVIGADGFGYERAEDGRMEKFLHLGGVIIEDDVEIGANACIDRGTLGDTIVRRGAKIDNLVHIAHNCDIGEDSVVIAQSLVGGSTVIGARAWIAPCACIRDGIRIGADATVGMGSVVTRQVDAGTTVMGAPARDAAAYRKMISALGNLSESS